MSFNLDGPFVIAINTRTTINCSFTECPINRWFILLRHSTVFGASVAQETVERFGITVTEMFMPPMLQLIVNTSNTSIVGLRCVGVVLDNIVIITRDCEAKIK